MALQYAAMPGAPREAGIPANPPDRKTKSQEIYERICDINGALSFINGELYNSISRLSGAIPMPGDPKREERITGSDFYSVMADKCEEMNNSIARIKILLDELNHFV